MPRKPKTPDTDTPATLVAEAVVVETAQAEPATESTSTANEFASPPTRFATFDEFYPFYIGEHSEPNNRRLHVVGTGLAILCLSQVAMWGVIGGFKYLIWAAIFGYGFAWAGHYFIEKNKPATFTYPAWSLMGDFKMFFEVVTGKRAW